MKTTYYLHMKPRHTAEQSTVQVNKAASTGRAGGFGFARPAPTASVPAPAVPEPGPVPNSATSPVLDVVHETVDDADDELDGLVCPTDPQERLQCDACQ